MRHFQKFWGLQIWNLLFSNSSSWWDIANFMLFRFKSLQKTYLDSVLPPGTNFIKLYWAVIYEFSYKECLLDQAGKTNTSLLQKIVNYGQKMFYNKGRGNYKTIYPIEEVNCTEPSPSVSVPWKKYSNCQWSQFTTKTLVSWNKNVFLNTT
jgi:hypothetical protein